jgi:hypothetical protein
METARMSALRSSRFKINNSGHCEQDAPARRVIPRN